MEKALTYESIADYKYFKMAYDEALRLQPVAAFTSIFEVTRPIKIGDIQL